MDNQSVGLLIMFLMSLTGLFLILGGLIIRTIPTGKAKKCVVKTSGHVVDYYYNGEMRVGPIVEFSNENGKTYRTKKKFEGYKQIKKYPVGQKAIWEDEKGWLHTRGGAINPWRNLAEEYWPIGSEMTVYFDPADPMKHNYVERPVKNAWLARVFSITGILIIAIGILMWRII